MRTELGKTYGLFQNGRMQTVKLIKRVDGKKSTVCPVGGSKEITVPTKKLRRIKTGV